jgi:CBS domain-containing protein
VSAVNRLHDYVAGDVMMHRPVTIDPHATLADAEGIFERYGFNCLPVHRGEALLGVLTKLDLLRALHRGLIDDLASYESIMGREVQSAMTRDPVTVGPRTPIAEVLHILVETRYKSVPVVIGALLLGVVSREDVTRAIRRAAAGLAPEPVHYWRAKPVGLTTPGPIPEAPPATSRNFTTIARHVHAAGFDSIADARRDRASHGRE